MCLSGDSSWFEQDSDLTRDAEMNESKMFSDAEKYSIERFRY